MNAIKKLMLLFKSNTHRALDQLLDARSLSEQINADLDKSIVKLTNSLTDVTQSHIRLSYSMEQYKNQLKNINKQIVECKNNGDDQESRKLAIKAIQYTNLITNQNEALFVVNKVKEEIKAKIRDMHDTKSEVEVASEVLMAEYETYSTLNEVSAHGGSVSVKSDALELLKSLSQRSKTEYLAKSETADFSKQYESARVSTIVSSDEIENYINNLK